MRNRIKYSQNFLRDNELVKRLVNNSSITKNDSVYEIGAGDGIITQALLNKAGWVVSFELDSNFVNKLKNKFKDHGNLELRHEDFLDYALPSQDYKVFSNIPFNITSAIIKKLTLEDNIPTYSYLIVQKEAAMKFAGKPLDNKNSQLSVILYPWFEFSIKHTFKSSDFFPKPNVDIVLLEIKKRDESLIEQNQRMMYEDFITYTFNQPKPSMNVTRQIAQRAFHRSPTSVRKVMYPMPSTPAMTAARPSDPKFEKGCSTTPATSQNNWNGWSNRSQVFQRW